MLTKVDNHPGLVRSADNKAILNTDITSLQAYRARRQRERKQDEIIQQWDNVVQDVADIKHMLQIISQKLEKL